MLMPRTIILLLIASTGLNCSSKRTQVRIDNLGASSLKSVVVHVRGVSHDLGDIPANDSKSVIVEPGGESSVELELGTEKGERKRLRTDFNLETGYSGFILVRIKDDSIAHAEKDYD
jgi:hypothetical protein